MHRNKPGMRTAAGYGRAAVLVAALALAGCAGYETAYTSEKVTICHKNRKTLVLPESAVGDHLAHGDTVGPCEQ